MLHNVKMRVVQTAKNGIVNKDTIFHFSQSGNGVSAHYSGGSITQGYLVGQLEGELLRFSYCQIRSSGELDHGKSNCVLSREAGKLQLEEQFTMTTGQSLEKGRNMFREL
ncbi:hypothetical protein WIW50_16685 [Flavobacteriaceae bacterium 3-367]|uniref:hypothetical protein n=1 Tax=Eudoraea algarum TaxID=3417568 RepID=UPI00328129EF